MCGLCALLVYYCVDPIADPSLSLSLSLSPPLYASAPRVLAGLLALLSEDDPALLSYALQQLTSPSIINVFWPEISDSVSLIEVVYENGNLDVETRNAAALLASKVYYHLGSTEDALQFALAAGQLFRVDSDKDQEYTDTIVAACIDRYIKERSNADSTTTTTSSDMTLKLQKIVEQMWNRCIRDGEYRQAMGIAIDAKRLDVIERVFNEAGKQRDLLHYVLEAVMTVNQTREDKHRVSPRSVAGREVARSENEHEDRKVVAGQSVTGHEKETAAESRKGEALLRSRNRPKQGESKRSVPTDGQRSGKQEKTAIAATHNAIGSPKEHFSRRIQAKQRY